MTKWKDLKRVIKVIFFINALGAMAIVGWQTIVAMVQLNDVYATAIGAVIVIGLVFAGVVIVRKSKL